MNTFDSIIQTTLGVLANSLWQGAVIAFLLAGVLCYLPRRFARARYFVACLALVAVPLVAFQSRLGPIEFASMQLPVSSHLVFTLWLSLAVLFLLKLAWQWLSLRVVRQHSKPVEDIETLRRMNRLAARLGCGERVELHTSEAVSGPCLLGWLRPIIVVPTAMMSSLSPTEIDAVLAHELAHARRWDYVANLLQRIIEAALFFNPAVWIISRIVRVERECCCDLAAAQLLDSPAAYARALLAVEESRGETLAQVFVPSTPRQLASRIERVFEAHRGKLTPPSAIAALLVVMTMAVGLPALVVGKDGVCEYPISITSERTLPDVGVLLRILENPPQWESKNKPSLFRSVPVFEKGGIVGGIERDLFEEFPNAWVLENELDLLAANLPQQDPDRDHFSNLEEYQAGTKPQDPASHPAFSEKVRFVKRQQQNYDVKFNAQPSGDTFQITRLATVKWPNRTTFLLKLGETSADGQFIVESFKDGVIKAKFIPTGKFYDLKKGEAVTMPIYFAELKVEFEEKPRYVKEGAFFLIEDERDQLKSVTADDAEIVRVPGKK